MRQLHDPPSFVPDRRQVAHLCHREQPFILGIFVGYRMQQVDVFDGRQTIDLEILQPP
jgi:hypothetical protein